MDLRSLPAVHRLASTLELPSGLATSVARSAVDEARETIEGGGQADAAAIANRAAATLRRSRPTSVINATGVLLHTNLGRAPLHPEAADAARDVALGYGNVELDLDTGARGGRAKYLGRLLTELTGAEAALVVNNNAGALLLVLLTLAGDGSVPVSRGELIEIGGSYRLPELMAAGGTRLVEVGTTNRTRIGDYAGAIDESTRMLLKVHPSNYRVEGFSEDAPLSDLGVLASEHDLPLIHDVGSGLLDESTPWLGGPTPSWLHSEPAVRQSLDHADLVTFSGDKMLGGPQAGVIVGNADLVARLKAHPAARALRIPGPTIASMTATLELYLDDRATEIPFWRMATAGDAELSERANQLAESTGGSVETSASSVGGGSVPGSEIPGPVVVLPDAERRWLALLDGDRPILARRSEGRLVVDPRTIDPGDDGFVAERLAQT